MLNHQYTQENIITIRQSNFAIVGQCIWAIPFSIKHGTKGEK